MNVYLETNNTSKCCGCGACANACPKNCISLTTDGEGFVYPTVDVSVCINCNRCATVCPFENREIVRTEAYPKAYGAHTKNKEYIMNSSSGGLFSEIANLFISQGGVVCGVTIDANHKVFHTVIDSVDDIPLLQGSKYVQSDLARCYPQIEHTLSSGKKLLFTGTPCQVSAVKRLYKSPNLYTLDVLCHGVPSQKLFDEYIKYLEKKHGGRLTEIAFRDKERNGWSITQRYKIEKKGKENTYYLDRHLSEYFSGFLRNMTQRESCYACPYTTIEREGDITLADFWGVDKVRPELFFADGTSLLFANSERGDDLIQGVVDNIEIAEVDIKDATYQNVNFISPPERHRHRSTVYAEVFSKGFKTVGRKIILPKNAYKYRLWALLQKLHFVGPLNKKRKVK